jgi:gliding motility-associated lipoprotein GldD
MRQFVWLIILACVSCTQNYSPKPRAYFRIDLPASEYVLFDSLFPFTCEIPAYSRFVPDTSKQAEPYWANLIFPGFRGTVHMSYKPVANRGDLTIFFDDARTFVNKHIPKATGISDERISYPEHDVHGMFYRIRGRESASSIQFYVTDSLDHFLRGALYFQVSPNNDSLSPVIERLDSDIRHMLSTLQWQQTAK